MQASYPVQMITPSIAVEMLKRNTNNFRNLRERKVSELALEMQSGRFRFNGDTICFGTDGSLIDGQHRLHACVYSGVSFYAIVVEGLDPRTAMTKDVGIKRQAADYLRHRNIPNAKIASTIARDAIDCAASDTYVRGSFSPSIGLIEFFIDRYHVEMASTIAMLRRAQHIWTASTVGSLLMMTAIIDESLADRLVAITGGEAPYRDGCPLSLFAARMWRNVASKEKLPASEIRALFIKAVNLASAGKRCKKLFYSGSETFPKLFGMTVTEILETLG